MVTLTDRDAHRRALGKWLTADGWDDRPDILVDLTPSVTEHGQPNRLPLAARRAN
ncbi:hypothetical protein PGT21_021785 [Puccinia graminis f. sp. tritici]|uniref:Uncharacterized protein n=1 Tax=Puccinia graminis f. sp. tritici TaxID=56615 RepID=A0A5B0N2A8_PUCGR|nr:hypothetical protein PGT21_021785 [Puccinia graminis f. sp. tritici]